MSRKKDEPKAISGFMKRKIDSTVSSINQYYETFLHELEVSDPNNIEERKKAEQFFQGYTKRLKEELESYLNRGIEEQEALERILPRAYALVKAASKFLWNKPHHDVQLIGGILLNDNFVSQMATGEGKTLTATLPAYLNALTGKGAHIITPNNYLAKRDQEEMSQLFNLLGLSCGLVEERNKEITEAEIQKRVSKILNEEADKLLKNIKDPTEFRRKKIAFLKYEPNISTARKKAKFELKNEKLKARRKAYQADITYGSANAFAFDYLYDDIALVASRMVLREEKPHFAIIDEVDAVLFDDAVTPFTISGKASDEELAFSDEAIEMEKQKIARANQVVAAIYRINETAKKIHPRYPFVKTIHNKKEFEDLKKLSEEERLDMDMTNAIILDTNSRQYALTTLGDAMIFQQIYQEKIRKILFQNKQKILSMTENNKPLFEQKYDYIIDNQGYIDLEPRAFAYLLSSQTIPELNDLFQNYSTKDYPNIQHEIDNAIKAWFIFQENVDYKLNDKGLNTRSISLVMNGRTAEGRVYAEGLQQAIEAKEATLKPNYSIVPTGISNTLASIPAASFFERYEKVGGMTGTAAKTAFDILYGLDTYVVPRNKPKQVIDRGEYMYATKEEKNEDIFKEVLKSYRKGQPVLLSTTSIEESQKLEQYLQKRFQENGIAINIPVLNANVSKLAEEAKIISKAGMLGAITISTEMAGRGTDIKLGGEVPEIQDLMKQISQEKLNTMIHSMQQSGLMTKENQKSYIQEAKKVIAANQNIIAKTAKRKQAELIANAKAMKQQVVEAGGLKIIGSGHFSYERVDNQVKGRCGRQGDPGEVIFFNSPEDLKNIGVPEEKIENLTFLAKQGPFKEKESDRRTPLLDAIFDAQHLKESATLTNIVQRQEVARATASCRNEFRLDKDHLKRTGDYLTTSEKMIEDTVKSIVDCASMKSSDHTKLEKSKIDLEELTLLTDNFLGITWEKEQISSCETIGDLKDFIKQESLDKFHEYLKKTDSKTSAQKIKTVFDTQLNRIWNRFEGYVEELQNQASMNSISHANIDMMMPRQIAVCYHHSAISGKACITRELIFPEYQQRKDFHPLTEIEPLRILPEGAQVVSRSYDQMQEELLSKHLEEASQSNQDFDKLPNVFSKLNNRLFQPEEGPKRRM